MKETEGWVKIKKYTDDAGKPVCGGCPLWATRGFFCGGWSDEGEHEESYPGPTCPIWHGESKSDVPPMPDKPGAWVYDRLACRWVDTSITHKQKAITPYG